ncbi:MAG: ASCH domain-containing protein [Candidatus Onthovivens sp.]|nr:ASCH domain-containing protein [Candidatus Onthovivens sp.]
MSKKIIISINPQHVKNIINGSKKYEYRTKAAKSDVNKILIYETVPVKKVVAEVEILEVMMLPPEELRNQTKLFSGITKEFFDEYFKEREIAYAYKLGKVKVFDKPKELIEFGIKSAPQSFVYISV